MAQDGNFQEAVSFRQGLKKNGMTRVRFEKAIMELSQETIDEMKRHAQANVMLEAMFGENIE